GFLRAAVRRLHHAQTSAGDDGPPFMSERRADRVREAVPRMILADPGRAEDRGGGPVDPRHELEARLELVTDEGELWLHVAALPMPQRALRGDRPGLDRHRPERYRERDAPLSRLRRPR